MILGWSFDNVKKWIYKKNNSFFTQYFKSIFGYKSDIHIDVFNKRIIVQFKLLLKRKGFKQNLQKKIINYLNIFDLNSLSMSFLTLSG